MGKPVLEKDSNLARAKLLLEKLNELNTHESAIDYNDLQKIVKIQKFIEDFKSITPRQYKALKHYSKVYGVKILQSLDFILD